MRALAATVASAAFLLCAGAAQAAVTASNITSPANGAYLQSNDNPPTPTTLTVTGTSNGTTGDHVDIDCWSDDNNRAPLASAVPVNSDGSFTATGSLTAPFFSSNSLAGNACRLRAEPSGASTSEDAAFTGPRIAVSEFSSLVPDHYFGFPFDYYAGFDVITGGPNDGVPHDFYANGTTFSSYVGWDSAGSCGPYGSTLDSTGASAEEALDCVGSLYQDDAFSQSEILVDGRNAYDVEGAYSLVRRSGTGTCPPNCNGTQDDPGFPSLSVSQSWNPANGLESTTSTEGVVQCTGADGYLPQSQTACPSFQPSGVQLKRTVMMTSPDTITVTDNWSSTDGKAHTVEPEYDDYVRSQGGGAGFQFPGEPGFSRHGAGDVVAGPSSAPGSIFTHSDVSAPDGIPDQNYGAITFASAPSEFLFSAGDEFSERQTLSVPAGGSASLTYIYSFGTTLAGVRQLALAAQDQLHSPAVSITAPRNGSKAKGKTVKVSGTATAGSGIKSVSVNGHGASIGSGGTWSATLPLAKGTDTFTATATSNSGLTASASVTVHAKACVVPGVAGLSLSKAEKKIKHAGCTVSKIQKQSSSIAKGHATGTKPHKGKKRKPGANITLFVSKGP